MQTPPCTPRYYGKSLPYGKNVRKHMAYLGAEQVGVRGRGGGVSELSLKARKGKGTVGAQPGRGWGQPAPAQVPRPWCCVGGGEGGVPCRPVPGLAATLLPFPAARISPSWRMPWDCPAYFSLRPLPPAQLAPPSYVPIRSPGHGRLRGADCRD